MATSPEASERVRQKMLGSGLSEEDLARMTPIDQLVRDKSPDEAARDQALYGDWVLLRDQRLSDELIDFYV